MLRSIGEQSGESVESVLKKKRKATRREGSPWLHYSCGIVHFIFTSTCRNCGISKPPSAQKSALSVVPGDVAVEIRATSRHFRWRFFGPYFIATPPNRPFRGAVAPGKYSRLVHCPTTARWYFSLSAGNGTVRRFACIIWCAAKWRFVYRKGTYVCGTAITEIISGAF